MLQFEQLSHPWWGINTICLAVPGAAISRTGRIGNRVKITDETAAVNTDGKIVAKAGHWGDLRRPIDPVRGAIPRDV